MSTENRDTGIRANSEKIWRSVLTPGVLNNCPKNEK
jgi:hypothetical protein